jgi:two-component system OmpR family sensor kinase
LGETIQHQAESSTPAKKNLYAFIEFFEFPIFIYDLKGTIRRSNASFQNEFMATKNLDVFSPYSDVLQFFVNKMLQPTRQEQILFRETQCLLQCHSPTHRSARASSHGNDD